MIAKPLRRRTLRLAILAAAGGAVLHGHPTANATPLPAALSATVRSTHPDIVRLQHDLASRPSATAVLQARCDALGLPGSPRMTATLLPDAEPVPDTVRSALNVNPQERIGTRHVVLACGGTTLSEAYNWYVPSRLTETMNHLLDTTHTPFGRAVEALHFSRETLSSTIIEPQDESEAARVLENHGLLRRSGDGLPIAYVVETYRRAAL